MSKPLNENLASVRVETEVGIMEARLKSALKDMGKIIHDMGVDSKRPARPRLHPRRKRTLRQGSAGVLRRQPRRPIPPHSPPVTEAGRRTLSGWVKAFCCNERYAPRAAGYQGQFLIHAAKGMTRAEYEDGAG